MIIVFLGHWLIGSLRFFLIITLIFDKVVRLLGLHMIGNFSCFFLRIWHNTAFAGRIASIGSLCGKRNFTINRRMKTTKSNVIFS